MVNLPPIDRDVVNRPKPQLPDRLLRFWEYVYYVSDLACWKADQAERYLSGVRE